MQQDQAGVEFQHRACASTLPSPNKILMDMYKTGKKGEKNSHPEDISWKNEGLEVAFLFCRKNFIFPFTQILTEGVSGFF